MFVETPRGLETFGQGPYPVPLSPRRGETGAGGGVGVACPRAPKV
jgi:hypothetical protein